MNNSYHWTTLKDLKITGILNPRENEAIAVGTVTNHFSIKRESTRVQFIGSPIISQSTKYAFVILMINDSLLTGGIFTSVYKFLTGSGQPSSTVDILPNYANGPLFTSRELASKKQRIKDAAGTLGLNEEEKTKIDTEIDFAINQMSSEGLGSVPHAIFLPVVIQSPIPTSIMNFTLPGYPFSLMDIAAMSPTYFYGGGPFVPKSGVRGDQHARGMAVDVTLAPYYARTGWVLREDTPHPFLSNTTTHAVPPMSLAIGGLEMQFGSQRLHSGDKTGSIVLSIEKEALSEKDVEAIFVKVLANNTASTFSFNPMGALRSEDKFWYHVAMTGQFNILDTIGTAPRIGET